MRGKVLQGTKPRGEFYVCLEKKKEKTKEFNEKNEENGVKM